jgi:hypothetical protein
VDGDGAGVAFIQTDAAEMLQRARADGNADQVATLAFEVRWCTWGVDDAVRDVADSLAKASSIRRRWVRKLGLRWRLVTWGWVTVPDRVRRR